MWVSSRFCYTFAIGLFSTLSGNLTGLLGFLLITVAGVFAPEDFPALVLYASLSVLFAYVSHWLLFGLLRPWGLKIEPASLRVLNDAIQNNQLSSTLSVEELSRVVRSLERLPMVTGWISAFFSISFFFLSPLVEWLATGKNENTSLLFLGVLLSMVVYVVFSSTIAEVLTGPLRKEARRLLAVQGIWRGSSYETSLTRKLLSLLLVMIADTTSLVLLLMEDHPSFWMSVLFVLVVLVSATSLSGLIFLSVRTPLQEIEVASRHIAQDKTPELLSSSVLSEFVSLADHFYMAAQENTCYRDELEALNSSLEAMVEDRVAQLNQALKELAEARDQALESTRAKSAFLASMSHEIRTH